MSLRYNATRGFIWASADKFSEQAALFIVQLILARFIAPEEFGLIAMVAIFFAIVRVFVEAGLSQAIIHKGELKQSTLNTVFFFNILMSLLAVGVLWIASPHIARFYNQPVLENVVKLMAIGIIPASFIGVHRAILQQRLDFRKTMALSLPGTIVGAFVGISMAVMGYGVWALVAQGLSTGLIHSLFFWFRSGWEPSRELSFNGMRSLMPYGLRLATARLIDEIFVNLYPLLIGKLFTPIDVGYYQRARSFPALINNNIMPVILRVAFPLFSSIKEDSSKFREAMRKAIVFNGLIGFVSMGVLAGLSEPMIFSLIGNKWAPSIPFMKLLCVTGALYPIHAINLNSLMALGRSDLFLGLEVVKKVVTLSILIATCRYGITVMLYGAIFSSFLALLVNTYFSHRLLGYGLYKQALDLLPAAILGITLFSFLSYIIHFFRDVPHPLQLVIGLFFAIAFIIFSNRWLPLIIREEIRLAINKLPSKWHHLAKWFGS